MHSAIISGEKGRFKKLNPYSAAICGGNVLLFRLSAIHTGGIQLNITNLMFRLSKWQIDLTKLVCFCHSHRRNNVLTSWAHKKTPLFVKYVFLTPILLNKNFEEPCLVKCPLISLFHRVIFFV